MSNTHFSYLRDPENSKRVITVARTVEDGRIRYGVATCRPDEMKTNVYQKGGSYYHRETFLKKGDEFRKSVGRGIALQRMNCPKVRATLEHIESEHPMMTIALAVTATSANIPEYIRRTFEAYVVRVVRSQDANLRKAPTNGGASLSVV